MSKSNDNNEKTQYKDLEIGKPYVVVLKTGSVITGVLTAKIESLTEKSGTIEIYRISLGGVKYLDVYANEIDEINELIVNDDSTGYFQELEKKYEVQCFSEDGELLDSKVLLKNLLREKKIWNKLSQEEKEELINEIGLEENDAVDIIDALMIYREENKTLHDDKSKIISATSELLENYNKVRSSFPDFIDVYDLFFKELGVERFVKEIC